MTPLSNGLWETGFIAKKSTMYDFCKEIYIYVCKIISEKRALNNLKMYAWLTKGLWWHNKSRLDVSLIHDTHSVLGDDANE